MNQAHLDRIQLLLIDDDEDDYVNLKGILSDIQRSKYDLIWKSSYQSGLEAVKQAKYDICLLDFRLGEKNGLDLLREIRGSGVQVPVILLTGHGDFEIDVKAMQSGAADYLVKTQITPPLLERAIRYSMKHALDMHELEEQRENFKVLFNSTFEGIVVHRQGRIVDANAAMEKIFGLDHHEILEVSLLNLFRSDFRDAVQHFLDTGTDVRMEAVGIRHDGAETFLEISNRTILLKGHSIDLVSVRDVTQRKQMEAQILQQDRLASLGLLASSLAHEIGTPLGVIRGRAELISKSGDEKTRSNMEIITNQIDRVSKLVNSLLHIARGGSSDSVADVNVGNIIQDVANLMSHELNRKSIQLEISIEPDLIARAEPGPLGQVILNLMVNSVHAIQDAQATHPSTHHRVSIVAARHENSILISVADTGTGISQANLKNLFKPFFTTKDIGLGTGLGLATSYKLVQSWKGTISAESPPGQGAKFSIRLPSGKSST